MDFGVSVVPSFPNSNLIMVPLLIGGIFGLIFLGFGIREKTLKKAITGGIVATLLLGSLSIFWAINHEQLQKIHDYPATITALEERYGVTLSEQDKAEMKISGPGKYSTINQYELNLVSDSEGNPIPGVYLQFSSGRPQIAALVIPEEDDSPLLLSTSNWWPELPVKNK